MSNWASAKLIRRAAAAGLCLSPATSIATATATATARLSIIPRTRLFSTSPSCASPPGRHGTRSRFSRASQTKEINDLKAWLEGTLEDPIERNKVPAPRPEPGHKPPRKSRAPKPTASSTPATGPKRAARVPTRITLTPREPTPLPNLPSIPNELFTDCNRYRVDNGYKEFWLLARKNPQHEVEDREDVQVPDPLKSAQRMHSFVQVVNAPTADSPGASLLLHFDKKRYLFGHVADGTQRLGVERGLHLQKVTDIFLTGPVSARNTGGLFGMLLTIADVRGSTDADLARANQLREVKGKRLLDREASVLNIHGGKNLVHQLASGRFYVLRKSFPVRPNEILADPRSQDPDASTSAPDFSDDFIRVWNVPLFRSSAENPRKRRRSGTPVPQEGSTPEADQELRLNVVRAMFESDWGLDKLDETLLSKIGRETCFYRADGKLHKYEGPRRLEPGFQDMKVFVRRPWPASKVKSLPVTTPAQDSMCYIVKEQPRRGKFLPQIAASLGVHKTKFKLLADGIDQTLEDGTVVKAETVMETPPPPVGFAILDVRDPALLESLLTRPEWKNPEIMGGVRAIYWILDESVTGDPRLAEFMGGFGEEIEHVILGENISGNELSLQHAATTMTNLNMIDPERFPLPVYSAETPQVPPTLTLPRGNIHIARAGEKLKIAPTCEFVESEFSAPMDPKQAEPGKMPCLPERVSESFIRRARGAAKRIANPKFIARVEESEKDIPQRDTEIIPLGTGSCMPSMSRNVSATLLRIPGWGTCILDCGESTLGQMRRLFGHEETDQILKDLRFIYISHLHADHHLGTRTVLQRVAQLQTPQSRAVNIICPSRYVNSLMEGTVIDNLGYIEFVFRAPLPYPLENERVKWAHTPEWISENVGLTDLSAVYVDHCQEALAASFTFPSGLKVAYSGDCRPSPKAFAHIGRNAHLLIHEATFDDNMRDDALAKKHCTFSEAMNVAKKMRARRVLLTHFSQRYPQIQGEDEQEEGELQGEGEGEQDSGNKSSSDDGASSGSESGSDSGVDETTAAAQRERVRNRKPVVLFAFDQMRVKLGDFKYANKFLPVIRWMLSYEEKAELEAGGAVDADCSGGNCAPGAGAAKGKKNKGKKDNKNNNDDNGGKKKEKKNFFNRG